MRIVVEPCFNEAHLLRCQIPNICEYLEPDVFIIAEGMFPRGPENSLKDTTEFKKKYTKDGQRSLDFDEVQEIVAEAEKTYPTKFYLLKMDYGDLGTNMAYYEAYMQPAPICDPSYNDLILTMECDLLFTRAQADEFLEACKNLPPGCGIYSSYMEFFESPVVVAKKGRHRRIAMRYGDSTNYRKMCIEYFTEVWHTYPWMKFLDLGLFHYAWVRPDWYFDMRVAQLPRIGPAASIMPRLKTLRKDLAEGKMTPQQAIDRATAPDDNLAYSVVDYKIEDHPVHMHGHPNFVRYYEGHD